MIERCGSKFYPTTGGITCVESVARSVYCLFCCKNFAQTYVQVDNVLPAKKEEKQKKCAKMFACCQRKKKNQVEGAGTSIEV